MTLQDLLDPILDGSFKGFPHASPPLRRSAVGSQGWRVLRGDLPFPVAVIRQVPLTHNLRWMQEFANDHGVDLAPHGKTTMSPQLFQRQLAAGGWGMTVANVTQLRTALAAGARRCIITNQVFAAKDLACIDAIKRATTDLRVLFLVDSAAQLDLISRWYQTQSGALPFEVLLEIGVAGGRTGCRDHAQLLALARRIKSEPAVCLAGIECYEGLAATGQSAVDQAYAEHLMQRVKQAAFDCDTENLFETPEILMSAGGSAIYDLVANHLRPSLSKPVRGVLRSGCYVTHDQGNYKRMMSAVAARIGCGNGLHAALEVWAAVQSLPEKGLAILTVGKRDISYDQEMPSVLRFCKSGATSLQDAPPSWKVTGLNDQHAYLHGLDETSHPLEVGDLICLGISHPCTTFDKWRWMPVVDEQYAVIDAIVTCF